MTEPIETLRPEVQNAMRELRDAMRIQGVGSHGPQFTIIRAELLRLSVENKRLHSQNRIQYDFLSSRQCPDHSGKWERGNCLQCSLEKAEAELASIKKRENKIHPVALAALNRIGIYVDGKLLGENLDIVREELQRLTNVSPAITIDEIEWLEYVVAHMEEDSEPEDKRCAEVIKGLLARLGSTTKGNITNPPTY